MPTSQTPRTEAITAWITWLISKNAAVSPRRKIESDPSNPLIIQNVVGAGYKLTAE